MYFTTVTSTLTFYGLKVTHFSLLLNQILTGSNEQAQVIEFLTLRN